jgi:membrane protease YdiL (CAAX protease family)
MPVVSSASCVALSLGQICGYIVTLMGSLDSISEPRKSVFVHRPVAAYFVLTFAVSWLGAFLVAAPHLIRREPLPKMSGILMFPVMLIGPALSGILLTKIVDGKCGLRDLCARSFRWRFAPGWYAPLLIPPALILTVLFILQRFVSLAYASSRFGLGILFGVPAGLLEEIGWTGYAFPKMRNHQGAFASSLLLGLGWAAWHLPVIDFLGAAVPHGAYFYAFFLSFALAMTAMRVLICWMYANTSSVLLAQLMHISSTGSLVVFGAQHVTARQEASWYAIYGVGLSIIVAVVSPRLSRAPRTAQARAPRTR